MKVVPRAFFIVPRAFGTSIDVGDVEVFGGSPFEEEFFRLNVNFLERAIPYPAILRTASDPDICRADVIDSVNCGLVEGYVELVKICCESIRTTEGECFLVRRV